MAPKPPAGLETNTTSRRADHPQLPGRGGLDRTDLEIVELLQEDARRTLGDIAARVNLSPPAVKRRIDRLGALGVIVRYTIGVDHGKLGRPIEAFVELTLTGTTPVNEIISAAAETLEVEAVFAIAGDPDALVHVRVADIAHLRDVIDGLRRSRHVTGTKTRTVLSTWSRVPTPLDRQRAEK